MSEKIRIEGGINDVAGDGEMFFVPSDWWHGHRAFLIIKGKEGEFGVGMDQTAVKSLIKALLETL